MRWIGWGLVIACFFACGDDKKKKSSDDDDGSGGATGTTTSTAATSGTGGSTAATCAQACSDLYDCGLESNGETQLCPGFTGSSTEKNNFLFGSGNDGCIASCEDLPALVGLIDPNDCPGTIATISNVNATFDDVCQFGFPGGQ